MHAPSLDAGTRGSARHCGFSSRALTAFTLALLSLGLAWRCIRYGLNFPIWGDEAMLALNFAWFDYRELTSKLANLQIAPLLFLWAERLAFTLLGPNELSLRLLPFLASVASLGLFWRLSGLLLDPAARLFAVGFLAVAIWPVSMGSLIKPYSLDLFVALLLLTVAVHWLRRPDQTRWLIALPAVAFLGPLASYPSVFVGGAVSLALAAAAWQGGWRTRGWFAAYNVALLCGFALTSAVGNRHLANATGDHTTKDGMQSYWVAAFPPHDVMAFVKWFVLQTTGQMTAYPVGASNGGSVLTVVLATAGIVHWLKRREAIWLTLLLTPFLLNLAAAFMQRYPYGGSCRLSQSLAPTVCILAGLGVSVLIRQYGGVEARQRRWVLGTVSLLALIGVSGASLDVAFPYRVPAFAWMRSTWAAIRAEVPADEVVVVDAPPEGLEPVFAWYWVVDHPRVAWGQAPARAELGSRVWGFGSGFIPNYVERLGAELERREPGWRLVKRQPLTHTPRGRKDLPQRFELLCFERSGTGGTPADSVSSRPAANSGVHR